MCCELPLVSHDLFPSSLVQPIRRRMSFIDQFLVSVAICTAVSNRWNVAIRWHTITLGLLQLQGTGQNAEKIKLQTMVEQGLKESELPVGLMTTESLGAALENLCRQRFPEFSGARVLNLAPISAGWECETYSFALRSTERSVRLIARIYCGNESIARHKCETEAKALRELGRAGYPVPALYASDPQGESLGVPLTLMQYIEGEWLESAAARAKKPAEFSEFVEAAAELLVKLHSIDPSPENFGTVPSSADECLSREIDGMENRLRRLEHVPDFRPAFEWLRKRLQSVSPGRLSVLHMDYHARNILVTRDRRFFVIDWTSSSVCDPRYDLGWSLIFLDRAEVTDAFLGAYERISGRELTDMDFFEVLACTRRLLSVTVSLIYGPEVLGMRKGAAASMKAQHEQLTRAYRVVTETTGRKLSEVERFLGSLP